MRWTTPYGPTSPVSRRSTGRCSTGYTGSCWHGVSIYGWGAGGDSGFLARHPELKHGKATIRLRPTDADRVTDDELRDLVRAALDD